MDEYIEALRVSLSSLSYKELQKQAKENSISAKQKKVKLIEALVKKHSRKYNIAPLNQFNSVNREPFLGEDYQVKALTEVANSEERENVGTEVINVENQINIDANAVNFDELKLEENFIYQAKALTEVANSEERENVGTEVINVENQINTNANIVNYDESKLEENFDATFTKVSNSENREDISTVTFDEYDVTSSVDFVEATIDESISENVYVKVVKTENRENIRIGLRNERKTSMYTPTNNKPRPSYTPYRGAFKYVDTTKMSNRDFQIHMQRKEEEKQALDNE